MKLEIITTNINETKSLDDSIVSRVELIRNFEEGGLTPTIECIKEHENNNIEVSVMLRETSSTFVYDDEMFQKHLDKLEEIKNLKIDNIVFGSLTKDNKINVDQLKIISKIVRENNKKLVFHRAFDKVENIEEAVKDLNGYIDVLLTSGTKETAILGKDNIKKIIELAEFEVMSGSGINEKNINSFKGLSINFIHIGTGARTPEVIDGNLDNYKILKLKKEIN